MFDFSSLIKAKPATGSGLTYLVANESEIGLSLWTATGSRGAAQQDFTARTSSLDYAINDCGVGQTRLFTSSSQQELDYFFCFGQDYAQAPQEWVDGKLDRRPRNPTYEVIFIYSKDEGKLDTYSKGGKREVPDLEAIFANVILGHKELEPKTDDNRIYDLDVFKERNFSFDFQPDSQIEKVVVRSMRLTPRYGDKTEFTLKGDYNADPKSVYEALLKLSRGASLDQFQITRVELGVHFRRDRTDAVWRDTQP